MSKEPGFRAEQGSEPAGPKEKGESTCSACGKPIQAAWKYCEHCGDVLVDKGELPYDTQPAMKAYDPDTDGKK